MPHIFPKLPAHVPGRGNQFSRTFFKKLFLAQGWQFVGEFPDVPKAVAIVTPHTSNYDAWYGFIAMFGVGVNLTIFGKDSLFNSPLKHFFKWAGVIPVERNSPHGLTQQVIDVINSTDKIWVAIAPEGTRKKAENFKSGFYRIASGANIPIVVFSFDYDKKTIRCLDAVYPTGDYEHDLEKIYALYQDNFSPKNKNWLSKPLQNLLKK